jgi:hypothetical protein
MLAMFKTATLASAVGVILSPRVSKKQLQKKQQQQQQQQVASMVVDRLVHTTHDGFVVDGSSSRRCASATFKTGIQTKGEQTLDGASANAANAADRRSSDPYGFYTAERQFAYDGFRSRAPPGTACGVSSRILSRAGSGISIAAYHPALATQDEGVSTEIGGKYAPGPQSESEDYLECSGGADDSSISSHFVPVDDSGSESHA